MEVGNALSGVANGNVWFVCASYTGATLDWHRRAAGGSSAAWIGRRGAAATRMGTTVRGTGGPVEREVSGWRRGSGKLGGARRGSGETGIGAWVKGPKIGLERTAEPSVAGTARQPQAPPSQTMTGLDSSASASCFSASLVELIMIGSITC
jgi:hypothetical protein